MDKVDRLMRSGLDQGIFPGGVLHIVADGETVFNRAYGMADCFAGRSMTLDTCFDLASLTKPLATVVAVMVLVDRGMLDLDQSIGGICPEIAGGDKSAITVRQLLTHSSGLPPWRPFFMKLRHRPESLRMDGLRRLLLSEPLVYPPGRGSDYSDLGFMFLQWIVESVGGQSLDRFVETEIYAPLGIKDLFFQDSYRQAAGDGPYAATQLCPWRGRLLVGQVDDDNTYCIGGVAGHAGLFGTADAVTDLLVELLAADQDGDRSGVFNSDLVSLFFESPENQRWALGFDTPSKHGSSAGRFFSADSVGHLGFTGTSFWMDRNKGVIVVFLTNRVHPFRFNTGIKAFRPVVHDTVMRALGITRI